MPHFPKPFFRPSRQVWYVEIAGKQHNLGPDEKLAFQRYHDLMRKRDEAVTTDLVVGVIDAFLDSTKQHKAPRTYEWYFRHLQAFAWSIPKTLTIGQLRPYSLTKFLDGHPKWSNTTKNGHCRAVQRAFRWAEQQGIIDRSPFVHFEKPRPSTRTDFVTPDEFETVLTHVSDDPFHDLLIAAWDTGARPQELTAVAARHVDLERNRWVFPAEESKGKKAPRVIYLTDRVLAITRRLLVKYRQGPLFRNADGKPWNRFALNCRFVRLKEKIGRKICLYVLRHSWATRALQKLDPLTVAILMGHSDPSMLAKVYQHLAHCPDFLSEAAKRATA